MQMKDKFCVKKKTLLLIAGIVWVIAGFNVARLGVLSYSRRYLLHFFIPGLVWRWHQRGLFLQGIIYCTVN